MSLRRADEPSSREDEGWPAGEKRSSGQEKPPWVAPIWEATWVATVRSGNTKWHNHNQTIGALPMFVNLMTTDEWCNRGDHGATSFEPTWIEVKQAIERLDGVSKTMVTLSSEEGGDRSLIIAGQWAGRFMVNATIDSYDFFSLIDPSVSEEGRIILFVGGQDGEYEERKLVFLEEVLAAARVFLETGEMERSLNWISDY